MKIGGDYMRLIDADALGTDFCDGKGCNTCTGKNKICIYEVEYSMKDVFLWLEQQPTIDAVPVETVCEMFGNEAPCNYGLFGVSVDDFMMSKCGKWCEDNCDKVPHTECWRKFFEAIEEWRKQND